MAGYARQSVFITGDTIEAPDHNGEYNQLVAAFNNTTGHKHDGTAAEGPVIGLIGDPGIVVPLNKVQINTANDRIGFFVDVAAASVEQVRIQDGAILPVVTNDIDLGSNLLRFKDIYIEGSLYSDGTAFDLSNIVTLTGTETLTNKTLTSPDINGGTIDGTVIGGTTPAAITSTKIIVDQNAADQALVVTGGSGGASIASFTRDIGVDCFVSVTGEGGQPQIIYDYNNGGSVWTTGVKTFGNYYIVDGSNLSVGTTIAEFSASGVTITGNTSTDTISAGTAIGSVKRAYFLDNVADANQVAVVVNDNAAATGRALEVRNDGTGAGVFIDQNGNSNALTVDGAGTTATTASISLNSATTGIGLQVFSNSAGFTGSNGLVLVQNSNVLATGNSIRVQNESLGNGIFIDQNGNGVALNIDGEETTSTGVSLNFSTLTTARALWAYSDSASFSNTSGLVSVQVDNALASGVGLNITNDGSGTALAVDQNGNSPAIDIATESTGTFGIQMNASGITSGRMMDLYTNSASFTGDGIGLRVDNALASGEGLFVQNDGTGFGIFVDQNGNANGLRVASDCTNTGGIAAITDSITTGSVISGSTASASFASNGVFRANITNSSSTGHGIQIANSGTGTGVLVDQNGNGSAIYVDTEAAGAFALHVDADALSTGRAIDITSSSSALTSRLASFAVTNATATGHVVYIQSEGSGTSLFVDHNSNSRAIDMYTECTTVPGMAITTSDITTGIGFYLYTNSALFNSSGRMIELLNDNAASSGVPLLVANDGGGSGVVVNQNGNGAAIRIDTNATSASGVLASLNAVNSASAIVGYTNTIYASSAGILRAVVDNASSSGTAAAIVNDGSGTGINVNSNGNGTSFFTDSSATTAKILNVTGDSVTTGFLGDFYSNSASTSSRFLLRAINDNSAGSGARVLNVQQDANNTAVFIDHNGNGIALSVDHEGTSSTAIDVVSDSISTGRIARLITNSTSHSNLFGAVNVNVLNASASGTSLCVQNSGTGRGLYVDQNGNATALDIDSEAASFPAILSNSLRVGDWCHDLNCSAAAGNLYGLRVILSGQSPDNTTSQFFRGEDSTTTRVIIYSDGDILNHDGTYGTLSDLAYKTNITPAKSQWNDVKQISDIMVNFQKTDDVYDYGEENAQKELGVIAQEIQEISPGLVKSFYDEKAGEDRLAVKTSIMYMKAFKALGEALEKIEELEDRIAQLENT